MFTHTHAIQGSSKRVVLCSVYSTLSLTHSLFHSLFTNLLIVYCVIALKASVGVVYLPTATVQPPLPGSGSGISSLLCEAMLVLEFPTPRSVLTLPLNRVQRAYILDPKVPQRHCVNTLSLVHSDVLCFTSAGSRGWSKRYAIEVCDISVVASCRVYPLAGIVY